MADHSFIIDINALKTVAYRSDADTSLHEILIGAVFEPPSGMTLRNIVGYADFSIDEDGLLYATAVMVDSKFQRQGIATAMYDFIEACYNTRVRPASLQTSDAQKFWKMRNERKDQTKEKGTQHERSLQRLQQTS